MIKSPNISATKYNLLFGYSNIIILIFKNIIIIPVYLNFFSLSTIGLWIASSNVLTILSSIDLGLNIVLTQKLSIINLNKKGNDFNILFSSGMLIFFIISVIFLIISFLYINFIDVIFTIPLAYKGNLSYSLLFTAIALSVNIIIQAFTSMFQALKFTFGTGLSSLLSNILEVVVLFLLLFYTKSLVSIGLSILIGSAFNLFLHFYLYKRLTLKINLQILSFDLKTIKLLFLSSVPLFFSRVTRALMNNSQATILSIFVSNQSAAIFEITVKLFKTANLFLAPIGSSIFSSIASSFSKVKNNLEYLDEFRFKIKRIILSFFLLSIIIFSYIIIINYNFISIWSGSNSYGGIFLTIACFFSFFFQTIARFLTFILNSIGVISQISNYEVLEMFLRAILLIVLVKYFGVYGIPISEILSTGLILLPKIISEINLNFKFNGIIHKHLKNEFSFFLIPVFSILFSIFFSSRFTSFPSLVLTSFIFIFFSIIFLLIFSKIFRNISDIFIQSKSITKAILGK